MIDYLTLKPDVFGMDISDLSLKIVRLKKKKGVLALSSFGEAEIKPGIVSQGEIKDENALSETIKNALSRVKGEKIKTKYVIASLPEEGSFMQVIQMPPMKEEEMKKAVYFEAENYIPMPIETVYLDAQIVKPLSGNFDHLDVLLAALPKKIADSYLASFIKAGLSPVAFEIESQAIARALVPGEKCPEPLLLIDFGATRTSFIIFSGYSIRFTVSLPISSQKLTETLAGHLKISHKESEARINKHGIEGKNGKNVLDAIRPDLKNLAGQIEKYLDYYKTHFSHEHLSSEAAGFKKVILCGGAANLKGLDNFLSQELNLQVVLGNPWSNILPKPLKEVPELSYAESLGYTTALGLALRGIKND